MVYAKRERGTGEMVYAEERREKEKWCTYKREGTGGNDTCCVNEREEAKGTSGTCGVCI